MFWEPTWEGRILAMRSFKGQEYTLVLSHPLSFLTIKGVLTQRAKRPTLLSHTSTFSTLAKEAKNHSGEGAKKCKVIVTANL